jgi:Putative addiction module component
MISMTREQVKEILDRVLTWPPERQEVAVRILNEIEQQETSRYRLSDEQVEEVERRRADFAQGRERYATDEEIAALWKRCGL